MDWVDLINGPGGALVLLLGILVSGARGLWVFGREIRKLDEVYERTLLDLRTDRDEWKRTALEGTQLAYKAVDVAERRQG